MTQKPPCKRCLLAAIDPEGLAAAVARRIALLPDDIRTDEAEYARRLRACTSCDMLTDGVCGACGCYAELRAAKRDLHCPHAAHYW